MAKTYDKVRYIETSGFNPHYNLAVESALLMTMSFRPLTSAKSPSFFVEAVKQAIKDVLTEKYGRLTENSAVDEKKIDEFYKKYSDDLWLYGKDVKLQSHKYKRFSWGYADVSFTLSGGVIKDIKVFSDSIFPDDIDAAIRALKGLNVLKENTGLNQFASDVMSLINE